MLVVLALSSVAAVSAGPAQLLPSTKRARVRDQAVGHPRRRAVQEVRCAGRLRSEGTARRQRGVQHRYRERHDGDPRGRCRTAEAGVVRRGEVSTGDVPVHDDQDARRRQARSQRQARHQGQRARRDRAGDRSLSPLSHGGPWLASGTFTINRLEFRIGENEWTDTSLLANEVRVSFKLALTGLGPRLIRHHIFPSRIQDSS